MLVHFGGFGIHDPRYLDWEVVHEDLVGLVSGRPTSNFTTYLSQQVGGGHVFLDLFNKQPILR